MSQAKVDRYKEEKANRKKIMKKEKREKLLWKIGGYAVVLVMVGWIGFSVYDKVHVETAETYAVATTAIDDYLAGLDEE
ncbi:MAG: hypothetical protein ACI4EI_11955 [Muricoprocola sp.]